MPKLRPYSTNSTLTKLDGRTKEARLGASLRSALVEHVGGKPTATQTILINQAVQLQLHIALLDRKTAEAGDINGNDAAHYLACCNSLSRLLRQFGLKGVAQPKRSLSEHLTQRPGGAA